MLASLFAFATLWQGTAVPPLAVRIDAPRHEIVLRLGPFPLPAARAHAGHAMHHAESGELPAYSLVLPVSGWLRGFRVALLDQEGRPLPRRILHHVNLLHLGRRQLALPILERTLAAGQETEDVLLPGSVGVRIEPRAELALLTAWANETGKDLVVNLELRIAYLPENTMPRPLEVFPAVFDVGFQAGSSDAFDLDTGRTVHQAEFVVPLDGRLLALGGHLHDYGESVQLVEVASGRVLITLKPKLDSAGRVVGMPRKLFGVAGAGLRLRVGTRYRVVAVYHNPTGVPIVNGGMALLAGIFAPADPRRWPPLDRSDPVFIADAAGLDRLGWVAAAQRVAESPRDH
jgi:hypothetical protein